MFDLFLPQIPLRTLRPGEIIFVFSLAEAQGPQRISMFCSYPKHLCVLCALARVNIDGFFYIANSGFTDKRS